MVVVLTCPVAVSMATTVAQTGVPISLAVLCHAVAYLRCGGRGRHVHINQDAATAVLPQCMLCHSAQWASPQSGKHKAAHTKYAPLLNNPQRPAHSITPSTSWLPLGLTKPTNRSNKSTAVSGQVSSVDTNAMRASSPPPSRSLAIVSPAVLGEPHRPEW